MDTANNHRGQLPFGLLTCLVMLVLRLGGVDIPWLVVFLPMWLPLLLVGLLVVVQSAMDIALLKRGK